MAENSEKQQKKQPRGKPFPKGVSGNPGGRPKGFPALIRERTSDGVEMIETAIAIMRGAASVVGTDDKDAKAQIPSIKERLDALKWLGSYAGGLPTQSIEHLGSGGGVLSFQIVRKVAP